METFLLVSAILSSFCMLIAIYRLNAGLVSISTDTGLSMQTGNLLLRLNTFGKWLTLFGGVTTFPLVMGLIFFSDISVTWIVNMGLAGCLALIAAAVLLVSAFVGICFRRHIQIKRMLLRLLLLITAKMQLFIRQRSLWLGLVGSLLFLLVLFVLFVPFFEQLVGGIVYLFGLVLIARLGLVDNVSKNESEWGLIYNYAKDRCDHGYELGGLYDDL